IQAEVNALSADRAARQQRYIQRAKVERSDVGVRVSGCWNVRIIVQIQINRSAVQSRVVVKKGVGAVRVQARDHLAGAGNKIDLRLLDVVIINADSQTLNQFGRNHDPEGLCLRRGWRDILVSDVIDVLLQRYRLE